MQRWLSRTSSLFSVRTHRRNWTQRAGGLVEAELPANPMRLLDEWLAAALEQGHIIERGFVLATSNDEEGPTARTVVCRDVCEDSGSITFGTNPNSLKGRSLRDEPRCEAVFRWGTRQVRLRGTCAVDDDNTEEMFRTLPRAARVSLELLNPVGQGNDVSEAKHQELLAAVEASSSDPQAPPATFSAYRITASTLEFYQSLREDFIVDRFLYVRDGASWNPPLRLAG